VLILRFHWWENWIKNNISPNKDDVLLMVEERLLQRIRSLEREPDRRERRNPRRVISSILSHLHLILNTRMGSVEIAEDYGIQDVTHFIRSFPETVHEFEESIRQTITKYEPRLTSVYVELINTGQDDFTIHFQISAKLKDMDDSDYVFFESIVDSKGEIRIEN